MTRSLSGWRGVGSSSSVSVPGAAPTVLLADDEDGVRQSLARALEEARYRVVQAVDGESALAFLKRRGRDIHVVVMEARMPRFHGYQLADWMAVWDYQQPIIFISGYSHTDLTLPGPLLRKPFPSRCLIVEVRRAFMQVGVKPPKLPIDRM
jgi:two-component system cell cycle response regulator CpdR